MRGWALCALSAHCPQSSQWKELVCHLEPLTKWTLMAWKSEALLGLATYRYQTAPAENMQILVSSPFVFVQYCSWQLPRLFGIAYSSIPPLVINLWSETNSWPLNHAITYAWVISFHLQRTSFHLFIIYILPTSRIMHTNLFLNHSNPNQLSIFPSPILKETFVIAHYFTFTVLWWYVDYYNISLAT